MDRPPNDGKDTPTASPSRCSTTTTSSSSSSTPSRQTTASASPTSLLRGMTISSSSSGNEPRSPNRFSKLFSQLKNTLGNLIVEAANTSADIAPGIDHCCKTSRCHYGLPIHNLDSDSSSSSSPNASSSLAKLSSASTFSPVVRSRLIVYRDCDRRGRKILFDSEHVSSDYVYLKPSDPKLLKQLGDYVFGCVPLASSQPSQIDLSRASSSSSTSSPCSVGHMRFCKWKLQGQPQFEKTHQTLHIWSKIFELGSYNTSNRSTKPETATSTSDYSSSSSEHSSSGYESGSGSSSTSSSSAGKTYSLPLFPPRLSSSWSGSQSSFPQTRSLPGRIDNYKTNLALVWILIQDDDSPPTTTPTPSSKKIPLPYLSPLVESLMLNPLSQIIRNFYHVHNTNHFVTSLKNVSTGLNHDLCDFIGNKNVVNLALVKPPLADMVNPKLVMRFLELFLVNLDSGIVLNLKKWTEVKAVLYFLKVVLKTCVCKCNLLDSRRDSLVETGTDVISAHELDCVDSGIDIEGTSSAKLLSSSSVFQAGRKWSVVSEEESDRGGDGEDSDDGGGGHVSFHLGDADADVDQSEAKLALGEVDLSRLKGKRRPSLESFSSDIPMESSSSSPKRPPLEVKLSLSDSKLKDACSAKYTPCYYCNGTYITDHSRFNPFYFCQVMTKATEQSQVTYDMEYVTFMKIIECYGSGSVRNFNLAEGISNSSSTSLSGGGGGDEPQGENVLSRKIKEFVEGYIKLAKVTNDSGKLDSYATFQMEEIRDHILE